MYSDVRNWKWMTPAVLCSVALLATRAFYYLPGLFPWLSVVSGTVAAVLAIAAIGNLLDYRRERSVAIFERNRRAMAITPLASELESARGVHPDVARTIIRERKRAWMLRGSGRNDVLFNAPNVTDVFMLYVLENSSESLVMAKNRFVEGRKNRFDPNGAVTEYEMYDDLTKLLAIEGKIHRWSEFSQWEWVKPWGPRSVAEDYRLEMDADVEEKPTEAVEVEA